MSDGNETNEECCLSPLDSARFIMERSKHVSINSQALQKLTSLVMEFSFENIFNKIIFVKISSAMMDGECSTDDWIGSDVGPPKGDIQSTIHWFLFQQIFSI